MLAPARLGRRADRLAELLPDVDGTGESLFLLVTGVLGAAVAGVVGGFLAGGLFLLFFGVLLDFRSWDSSRNRLRSTVR